MSEGTNSIICKNRGEFGGRFKTFCSAPALEELPYNLIRASSMTMTQIPELYDEKHFNV